MLFAFSKPFFSNSKAALDDASVSEVFQEESKMISSSVSHLVSVDVTDQDALPVPDTHGEGVKKLAKLRKNLLTMLSIIGRKVDQFDYDDVMNESTSLASIWNMIELVYDIGRKGVHFLELGKIKYETGESPANY